MRSKFRVTCTMTASAAMTNVRRMQRHVGANIKARQARLNEKDQFLASHDALFHRSQAISGKPVVPFTTVGVAYWWGTIISL